MLDRSTENHGSFITHILQPSIYNQTITLGNIDFTLKVANVVLDTIKPDLCQINICMDTDTANGDQLADLHSGLNVQLMRCVLESIKNDLVIVCSFRGGS